MKSSPALLLLACLASAANAAEWSASPVMSWSVNHDSNRLLIEDGPASEAGNLQMDVLLKRMTGSTIFTLQPHAGWRKYTHEASRDADNQSLQAGGVWLDDRSSISAQAALSRDNSLNAESPENGIFLGRSLRKAKNGSLAWSHQHSDRGRIDLQASYADVQYEDERFLEFFGLRFPFQSLTSYKYPSLSVTETTQWSPRTSLQFTTYAARLIAESGATDSDSYGARVGLVRSLSAHFGLSMSAGLSRQSVNGRNNEGYIGRIELTHKGELDHWRLYGERSVSASGYGFLVTQDDAGLSLEHRFAPHWSIWTSLRFLQTEDIIPGRRGEQRRWERADTGLGWQATRSLRLSLLGGFVRAQQARLASIENGWSATAAATWTPQLRRLSR